MSITTRLRQWTLLAVWDIAVLVLRVHLFLHHNILFHAILWFGSDTKIHCPQCGGGKR